MDLIPKDKRKLRWFLTPQEVSDFTSGVRKIKPFKPIFVPIDDLARESESDSLLNTFRSTVSNPEAGYNHKFVKRKVSDHTTNKKVEPQVEKPYKSGYSSDSEAKVVVRNRDLNKHFKRLSEIPKGQRKGDGFTASPNQTPRKRRDLSLSRLR